MHQDLQALKIKKITNDPVSVTLLNNKPLIFYLD